MPRPVSRHPALPDLVDLAAQLRRDEQRERAWLWRRDREIGRDVAHLKARPAAQIMAWLERAAEDTGRAGRERVAQAQRLIVLVLILLGLAAGWATAAAVFYYTGDRPVNVVGVLAVFVGLQLLLVGLFLLAAIPNHKLRWLPGAGAVLESFRLLSPGRLAPLIARWLPQEYRDSLAAVMGRGEAHQQRFASVQKWAILTWSQGFAVAFNVGALLRYLYLVFFSDLAFVWSTTLQTDASVFHGITRVLAWPWGWALPDAAPTYELVRATRYFRFDDGAVNIVTRNMATDVAVPVDPGYFGGWWPFLLMCLVMYGLLPRVLTLGWSAWRMRRAVSAAVVHTPGAAGLLDRLNSVYVQSQSSEAGEAEPVTAGESVAPAASADRVRAVVNWSGVPMTDAALGAMAGHADAPVHHAGGVRTLDDDRAAIRAISAGGSDGGAVVVAVKSWEPPVLEVLDFLSELRRALGQGVPLIVLPVPVEHTRDDGHDAHLAQWRRKLAAVGDPWLAVGEVTR